MGYVHSREAILEAALRLVQDSSLTEVTFRAVGERAGIPDRTVVYYFPTKKQLLSAILEEVTSRVRAAMARELGNGSVTQAGAVAGIWTSLATREIDPVFRVYIELFGLAAAQKSPYTALLAQCQ